MLEESRLWCESRTFPVGLAPVIEQRRLRREEYKNQKLFFGERRGERREERGEGRRGEESRREGGEGRRVEGSGGEGFVSLKFEEGTKGVEVVWEKGMSSCAAGGQFVISVHCLLKSYRFGRDSRFVFNKFLGALAANLGSGSSDGGLSSIAVCSLHGYYGNSFHIVVLLIAGFSRGLLCGTGLLLCFWATSTLCNGSRSAA